jgi:hypothetical protein
MIHNHWLSIAQYDVQPLTGAEENTMIHNHWLSITRHDSQPLSQNNTLDSQPLAQDCSP